MLNARRALIIVTAPAAAAANGHTKQVDAVGGERAFTVPLSPTGLLPATHYWCSWQMTQAEWDDIHARTATLRSANSLRVFDGDTITPAQALTTMGLQRIEPDLRF